jgi:hypothetical protein
LSPSSSPSWSPSSSPTFTPTFSEFMQNVNDTSLCELEGLRTINVEQQCQDALDTLGAFGAFGTSSIRTGFDRSRPKGCLRDGIFNTVDSTVKCAPQECVCYQWAFFRHDPPTTRTVTVHTFPDNDILTCPRGYFPFFNRSFVSDHWNECGVECADDEWELKRQSCNATHFETVCVSPYNNTNQDHWSCRPCPEGMYTPTILFTHPSLTLSDSTAWDRHYGCEACPAGTTVSNTRCVANEIPTQSPTTLQAVGHPIAAPSVYPTTSPTTQCAQDLDCENGQFCEWSVSVTSESCTHAIPSIASCERVMTSFPNLLREWGVNVSKGVVHGAGPQGCFIRNSALHFNSTIGDNCTPSIQCICSLGTCSVQDTLNNDWRRSTVKNTSIQDRLFALLASGCIDVNFTAWDSWMKNSVWSQTTTKEQLWLLKETCEDDTHCQ